MRNKRMTSWERRRRRTIRITVITTVLIIIALAAGIFMKLSLPYETWNIAQFYNITFDGYNTEGNVVVTLDENALNDAIDKLKADYRDSLLHLNSCSEKDYDILKNSISATVMNQGKLSNGSKVTISYSYDKNAADKVNVSVIAKSTETTVTGLINAVQLTKEDIFKDLEVSFSGISPDITMTITNNSSIPFIQNIIYNPVEPKDTYKTGDVVTIRAFYSQKEALKEHYSINLTSEDCTNTYMVSSDSAYISSPSELPQSIIDEAILSGNDAFTNANEFGVRIFCEANLVPVYVNKQATFEWEKHSFRSAYFKCVRDEYAGSMGNHYNDLDLVYSAVITQANGVKCPCYAVVRFSDLIIKGDGSIIYDFSDPKVISADYKVDSIHKTVSTNFEGTHTVTKIMGN